MRQFEKDLEVIRAHLLLMGEKSYESVSLAIKALLESEPDLRKIIYAKDNEIDELENQVDAAVTSCLSTCAPVAADLRFLVTTIKVSHELERIGDEAKAIARRTKRALVNDFHVIPQMAELALAMLQDALDVFVEFDEEKAHMIWSTDIAVDEFNRQNSDYYASLMTRHPELGPSVFEMVFISKSLERVADHAVSISKEVVFMATSKEVRHAVEFKKSSLKKKLKAS